MGNGSLFLVGMMGSGKTTLGRALAARLQRRFFDTDKVLVERTGVPVATIFEIEGEDGFRKRESAILVELAGEANAIVATGGGAVLDAGNRRVMRESGTVIYLRAKPEHLWQRLRHDTSRPLLATPDPLATLETILAAREPLYRDCAHLTIDTGPQSAVSLAGRVLVALKKHEAGAAP